MNSRPDLSGSYIMETASGRAVILADPDPASICFADIAHHLAQVNRYNGATGVNGRTRAYPVAEHAVLVAQELRSDGAPIPVCLAGLHHDDSEAYLGDVSRPLKALLPEYREIERRFETVIRTALDLPSISADEAAQVKAADNWALAAEAHYLMPSAGKGWTCDGLYEPRHSDRIEFEDRMSGPERARLRFMHMDEALRRQL